MCIVIVNRGGFDMLVFHCVKHILCMRYLLATFAVLHVCTDCPSISQCCLYSVDTYMYL